MKKFILINALLFLSFGCSRKNLDAKDELTQEEIDMASLQFCEEDQKLIKTSTDYRLVNLVQNQILIYFNKGMFKCALEVDYVEQTFPLPIFQTTPTKVFIPGDCLENNRLYIIKEIDTYDHNISMSLAPYDRVYGESGVDINDIPSSEIVEISGDDELSVTNLNTIAGMNILICEKK